MFEDQSARLNEMQQGFLPGVQGVEITEGRHGYVVARLTVEQRHMAPNGYLHAATAVMIADTVCGYGCRISVPEGATGFTTIETKSNHLATATPGQAITAEGRLAHGGRMTQVWDAEVKNAETGKTIALFRCTQMILYPR